MTTVELDKPAPTMARATVDWERHGGHGGPKIKPPPGEQWLGRTGKPVGHRYYTRVTTLAKAIDDTSKLMAWKMRGVLVGLGQRPAYVVAAAGLTLRPEDRAAADELAEKALQAAKGDDAALIGTALHTFTERLDRGEDLGHVPDQLRPLVDAYARLTVPLTFLHREVRMVCDDLETAGTPDAIGTCAIPDPDGVVDGLRIIDLKSGKVAYPGPMSIQLATYGRSDLYDPATGARTPLEGVNQRWGLIVHVQQDGEVPPGLYWLNLEHGNQGIELCRQVRTWRKVKPQDVLRPVEDVTPAGATDALVVEDTVVIPEPDEAEPVQEDEAPAAAIVCGRGGEPTAADRQAVAAFGEFLETAGPPPALPQEDDEAAADGTDAWDVTASILAAVTTSDLDLLWNTSGRWGWPADVVELATARHAELWEAESLARPRAALSAALRTATAAELHALWTEHGGTQLWTAAHAQVAQDRYGQLQAAGLT